MSNLRKDMHVPGPPVPPGLAVVTCPSCRTRWRWVESAGEGDRCKCSRCATVFAPEAPARAYAVRAVGPTAPAPTAAAVDTSPARRPGGPVGPALELRVGMDDPSLAERVSRSALNRRDGGRVRAWTWTVMAPERDRPQPTAEIRAEDPTPATADASGEPERVGPASLRDAPGGAPVPADDPVETATAESDTLASFGGTFSFLEGFGDEGTEAGSAEPVPGVEDDAGHEASENPDGVAGPERAGSTVAGFLGVVLLGGAGAAAGWFGAVSIGDAVASAAASWPGVANWTVPREPEFWAGPGALVGLILAWGWARWNGRSR